MRPGEPRCSIHGAAQPSERIDACVKSNGALRILATAGTCKADEHALSWNVVGPAGPPGPTGSQGPAGQDGASVVSAPVADGSTACPHGGSSFAVADRPTTYACNGAPGTNGTDGKDGAALSSVDGLAGLACSANGRTGTTALSYDSNGRLALTCGGTSCPSQPTNNGTIDCNGTVTCNAGALDLNHDPSDGCEENLETDAHNCGRIGNDISVLPHAVGECVGGQTQIYSCNPGWFSVGANNLEGCQSQTAPCPHDNGLGGVYDDCDPLGTPGVATTYTGVMQKLVPMSWVIMTPDKGPFPGGLTCGGVNVLWISNGTQAAAWQFTGSLAGHVHLSDSTTPSCPTADDPVFH